VTVPATARPKRDIRDYGLSIVAFTAFLVTEAVAAIAGWVAYVAEQEQHKQPATFFGDQGYGWVLGEQTFQNWQSEFLAVAVLVWFSAFLLHLGSKQSREGNDEAQARVTEIQHRVERLVASKEGR
jgi:predicted small integral membrane protein